MRKASYDFDFLRERLRPPVAIVLGSPAEVVDLLTSVGLSDASCYQMDLYQAQRLEAELREIDLSARVVTQPDLWDLPAEFRTVLYPAPAKGERALKIDMVEQAYHILQPHGQLVVLSPYEVEQFFPGQLKKVFGRYHAPHTEGAPIFWSQRSGDHPRRRHEVTFQVRAENGPPFRFLSRPGVFSYGRFDEGARALTEIMQIGPGERIIDIGCGCGTNGVIAARRSGPESHITFVDSNVRALALAEINAENNGVTRYETIASSSVEGMVEGIYDVALANPPYFAQQSIAALFIDWAHGALKRGGRLYLVTRQVSQVVPMVEETFGNVEGYERRGYMVLIAQR